MGLFGQLGVLRKALAASRGKQQGVLGEVDLAALRLPPSVATLDPARIAAYSEVCGFRGPPVPISYPEVLFINPMADVVTSRAFPTSSFGLIHVAQTLTQREPLEPGDRVELHCGVERVQATDRGVELAFLLQVMKKGSEAWQGTVELLSRNAEKRSARASREAQPEPSEARGELLEAPGDIGRRYAAVSDDYNPHHLYTWTARPFGYRRPIAHGMWTLAAALGWLDVDWEQPRHVQCTWRKPLLLPGRARLTRDGDAFAVHPDRPGTPHLEGTLGAP